MSERKREVYALHLGDFNYRYVGLTRIGAQTQKHSEARKAAQSLRMKQWWADRKAASATEGDN